LSTHDAQLVRQYYYVDMSPSTYVDLGVAVRGHLAQGTYVHVRENLIVALCIIVTMLPQDTLRQLSGVDCTGAMEPPLTISLLKLIK
jgi:hypothetical protein